MVVPALPPSIIDEACASQMSNLSTLTTGGNKEAIAGCIQSPMRKQHLMTASAWQQKQVGDIWLKRHKVMAHKEAMQHTHRKGKYLNGSRCCLDKCRITFTKRKVSHQVVEQYKDTQRKG
jgi:hypothetical protein